MTIRLQVLGKDFFAVLTKDEFVREARILMFETIARIHKYIDLRCVLIDRRYCVTSGF